MQEVQLDSKVKLLDSPGVVLASGLKSDASVALRNAIRTGILQKGQYFFKNDQPKT